MKCHNCKENFEYLETMYKFCGKNYCYDCIYEYIRDSCLDSAIELWLEQNTEEVNI